MRTTLHIINGRTGQKLSIYTQIHTKNGFIMAYMLTEHHSSEKLIKYYQYLLHSRLVKINILSIIIFFLCQRRLSGITHNYQISSNLLKVESRITDLGHPLFKLSVNIRMIFHSSFKILVISPISSLLKDKPPLPLF